MSAFTCAQVRELAPELALDVLTGAERAEAVAHVNECARCRSLVTDLSGAADTLTLLVPEAEPPPGFEDAVLGAFDARRRRRRARLRQVSALALAAAAACIVTLVLVRVVDSSRDPEPTRRAPSADVLAAPMIGADDQLVGQVFVTGETDEWAYLFVDYEQLPSGTYRVVVDATAAGGRDGEMQVSGGRGFWSGRLSAPGRGAVIQLATADGTVVCEGALPG